MSWLLFNLTNLSFLLESKASVPKGPIIDEATQKKSFWKASLTQVAHLQSTERASPSKKKLDSYCKSWLLFICTLKKEKHARTQTILSVPSKQITNQSDFQPLNSDNDSWKAVNGLFCNN